LELGKVEIEWILDEDLWKTLYNKTSTLINPWMIKLEQTSCTLCMNKFQKIHARKFIVHQKWDKNLKGHEIYAYKVAKVCLN
jgi:hypothetical protein